MSIREKINGNPAVGIAVAIGLIVVAVAVGAFSLNLSHRSDPHSGFFSDDDGQTYFKDSIYKFPPFDHDGKTAVAARVYTDGKHNFVGYLERFTATAKKRLEEEYNKGTPDSSVTVINLMISPGIAIDGMEVKKPGPDNNWVPRSRMAHLPTPTAGGSDDDVEAVLP
jgi:hypothetical protein